MKILYVVFLICLIAFLILYIFMSIRLSVLTKKKEENVRKTWVEKDLNVVAEYKKATRVTLREIFLGADNGKTSKK